MKKNGGKIIAGVLLLAGGYFIYRYFAKPKVAKAEPIDPFKPSSQPSISKPSAIVSGVFPLKKGSKGAKVKELQQAILKYDPKALPKFGADGDFGSETQFAVSKILGKTSVDSQADIDKIIAMYNKREFPYITANAPATNQLPSFRLF